MAYDAIAEKTLVVSGLLGSSLLHDTWQWNGSQWEQVDDETPAGFGRTLVFHSGMGKFFYRFGTTDLTRAYYWEDGWHRIAPSPPLVRTKVAMAYDGARDKVVAFDGLVTDTWEWEDTPETGEHVLSVYAKDGCYNSGGDSIAVWLD